jgi:hypothetical protein
MSLNRFLDELANLLGRRSTARFGRDLARTLGFRVKEPSHGSPVLAGPSPNALDDAEARERSYKAGHTAGRDWATHRAFVSDIRRLATWVTTAPQITGAKVALVIDGSGRPFVAADVEALRRGDEFFAMGFVDGALKF